MMRVGQGVDVHAFSEVPRALVLGGVEVSPTDGLAGHSDADALSHAVADALLGALALGDLGERFGVDDPAVAGADSMRLLADVVADVHAAGWRLGNLDATVLAQRPRLAPHRQHMRVNLAGVLQVGLDAVSVKATTTDRLGFLGRGDGIAATAVALLLPSA